jgi:hypothetical protein
VHSIYVRDLPSLIDVLAKISSIASAALSTPQPRRAG